MILGRPRGDLEHALSSGLSRAADVGGSWALVTPRVVATDAFAGVPLFLGPDGPVDPAEHRGPVDPRGVRQFLTAEIRDPTLTLYQHVKRVPGGWGGPPDALQPIWHPRPVVDADLRATFDRVVAHHPPGDVALSGGLDSSVVACTQSGRAISNRFEGWSCDEGPWIDAVVRHRSLQAVSVDSRRLGPEDLATAFAPPGFPAMAVNHYLMGALMRESRVLWSGFGGDEIVGHEGGVLHALVRRGQPVRAVREAVFMTIRNRIRPEGFSTRLRRNSRGLLSALTGRAHDPIGYHLRTMRHPYLHRCREEQLRLAAWHGTTLVQPFLDAELAQVSMSLPRADAVRHGRTRQHLRDAFADLLPPETLRRSDKSNLQRSFDQPFARFLQHAWPVLTSGVLAPYAPDHWATLRAHFEDGDALAGAALWRAYGAARWLTWHAVEGQS